MRIFYFFLVVFGLTLTACGAPETNTQPDALVTTNWTLVSADSRVEFISVKKGTIVETHSFTDLSGMVLRNGVATVSIHLNSLETNIDIRNERMKKHLFETDRTDIAGVSAVLNLTQFETMAIGARKDITLPISLIMHSNVMKMDIVMVVTRLGDNKVVVESRTPVILDTDKFNFAPGILKLQELAKLNVIATEVPVMFSLTFERG